MSFKTHATMAEVHQARAELDRRGWSYRNSALRRLLWRASRGRYPRVGDDIKSWDVLLTARFAQEHLALDDPILDLGAFGSEIPPLLLRAGFNQVYGVDLNPNVRFMPDADRIRYVTGNFHRTPFEPSKFALVTAISVIEHGFSPSELLVEVARILRPGGYFVASFDYWPQKVATDGIRIFGLDWRIFSREEVGEFVAVAASHGFVPCGEVVYPVPAERPVDFAGQRYTFGWLAMRRGG